MLKDDMLNLQFEHCVALNSILFASNARRSCSDTEFLYLTTAGSNTPS
jgi:hypothetical protein